MVIFNTLVSCIIGLEKRFWPSITSIAIGVIFFTKGSFSCHTNSLSMKHVNAPKSSSALVFIVTDLLHLIMIGNKKQGVGFEDRLGPFWSHDASRSNFTIPINTRRLCFPNLQDEGCWHKWLGTCVTVVSLDNC
jgi:hypothetical protein